MIQSMTGFGDASCQIDGFHYAVEVRSLNNRYFKTTIRLPEPLAGLEAELENLLRRRLQRGSVTAIIKLRLAGTQAVHRVNDAALISYLDHLSTIQKRVAQNQEHALHIDLTSLLQLPGVLQPAEDEDRLLDKARPVVTQLIEEACGKLIEMRIVEGQTIVDDLLAQKEAIQQRLLEVIQRAPQVVQEYHQRLRQRVDELMARASLKASETDLVREVALYAEKSDVSEETKRLAAHLDQFKRLIAGESSQPVGRTLDFLCQELLREANTIASKSNDAQISRAVVDVKGAIDRIKEQVQNVA